jgi:CheY-like chemotaxis protein
LLAGRKLLLADDSITIQKVVELTFADEGVEVLCFNNGRDAVERLEEFAPDVVLADVLMPQMNGYEVCEFIKQNPRLKHTPVMLLVGSFEPYDESEARRVGADETLTKPFQSIRSLIDKVGQLVSNRPPADEAPTAELPRTDVTPEPELLSEQEMEITTADTRPLPPEFGHITQEWALPGPAEEVGVTEDEGVSTSDTKVDEAAMESNLSETPARVSQSAPGDGDGLLDLGYYEPTVSASADEFSLDLDLDEPPEESPVASAFPTEVFAKHAESKARAKDWTYSAPVEADDVKPEPSQEQLATTLEFQRPVIEAPTEAELHTTLQDVQIEEPTLSQTAGTTATEASLQSLSPELIDAIARRVVEQLSEKVVQEIAWEVVPPLAELLIKRQLEEKNS